MAWSAPRTWSPGETVTASLMNAHVRDNLNAVSDKAIIFSVGAVGGPEISTGYKSTVEVPVSLKITGWTLLADVSGDVVIHVLKDTFANAPPETGGDEISGSEHPTLSAEIKAQDLSLSTWDEDIDAGDVMRLHVDSVTTVAQFILTLRCEPR